MRDRILLLLSFLDTTTDVCRAPAMSRVARGVGGGGGGLLDMSAEKKRQLYKMIFYLLSDDYVPSVSVSVSSTG